MSKKRNLHYRHISNLLQKVRSLQESKKDIYSAEDLRILAEVITTLSAILERWDSQQGISSLEKIDTKPFEIALKIVEIAGRLIKLFTDVDW